MDIPIRFKIYLFWKNLFSKKEDSPHIKITKEGRGVRSVLFFLPEKKEDAKVINYFVKVENPLSDYEIGLICSDTTPVAKIKWNRIDTVAVSYTHLTLPTILLV